ncbi:hypothetical protein RAA17_22005 [Komagataeibacter rhaeticus]|nr:hypothetical protein [Komagataeibacter rhaeticus]
MAREDIRTVCPYCGVGCGVILEVENGRIAKVRGMARIPPMAVACARRAVRVTGPSFPTSACTMPRSAPRGEKAVSVAMRQAIDTTAARLRTHPGGAWAGCHCLYVSGQMSLEAQYSSTNWPRGLSAASILNPIPACAWLRQGLATSSRWG